MRLRSGLDSDELGRLGKGEVITVTHTKQAGRPGRRCPSTYLSLTVTDWIYTITQTSCHAAAIVRSFVVQKKMTVLPLAKVGGRARLRFDGGWTSPVTGDGYTVLFRGGGESSRGRCCHLDTPH